MAKRLNTTFSRRTSSKRRITNIANRFDQIKGEVIAHQTTQGLHEDMRDALSKVGEINEQLWSLLEAAEVSADRTTTSHTVSEDISDSDQYVTKAEDTLFEISRYRENHPAEVNPAVSIAASVPSSARGHKISFRAMTHDDCRLWFAQLEDVFASLGISSQNNKFAALTTLLTEEEAYVVRDLTMMGDERPSNVFDGAMSLFVKRYELTVHQIITRWMKNPHNGWPDFGTPEASGTEKMSNDGLSYATYHRHYEQPSNCRHRNYQWTNCCKRQTHCTSRCPPRQFRPSRKCQPN